jgi:hypothetical protein
MEFHSVSALFTPKYGLFALVVVGGMRQSCEFAASEGALAGPQTNRALNEYARESALENGPSRIWK